MYYFGGKGGLIDRVCSFIEFICKKVWIRCLFYVSFNMLVVFVVFLIVE